MGMKKTILTFRDKKLKNEKISMVTAYDYTSAKLVDNAGIDSILVGDSLGMVIQGSSNTLGVTLEDIIYHTKTVVKGASNAFIVSDMPFLSYEISVEEAVKNAGRLLKEGGANAIKLEGGSNYLNHIKAITEAKIPVMGHLGLTPQSINSLGGFKVQGKNLEDAKNIIEDALALQKAGAFCIVLECIPEDLAKIVSKLLDIPTIGIGSGKYCDGQVLVFQDMFGLNMDFKAKFVKEYKNLGKEVEDGIKKYINEINDLNFPSTEHIFKIEKEIIDILREKYCEDNK